MSDQKGPDDITYPSYTQPYSTQSNYPLQHTSYMQNAYPQGSYTQPYGQHYNQMSPQQQTMSPYSLQYPSSNYNTMNYSPQMMQQGYGLGAQVGVSYPVPGNYSSTMSNYSPLNTMSTSLNNNNYTPIQTLTPSQPSISESRLLEKTELAQEKNSHKRDLQDKQNEDWSQNNKKRSKYEDDVPEDNSIEKSEDLDKSEENKSEEEVEVVWPEDAKIPKKPLEEGEEEDEEEKKEVRYTKVLVNGDEYSLGDTVALWPPSRRRGAPMGTIKCLLTDGENNNMEIEWFYRVEETILKGNRRNKTPEREIFLSSHADLNPVESIQKKVTIKWDREVADLDEYIKSPDSYYYTRKYNYKNKCFENL